MVAGGAHGRNALTCGYFSRRWTDKFLTCGYFSGGTHAAVCTRTSGIGHRPAGDVLPARSRSHTRVRGAQGRSGVTGRRNGGFQRLCWSARFAHGFWYPTFSGITAGHAVFCRPVSGTPWTVCGPMDAGIGRRGVGPRPARSRSGALRAIFRRSGEGWAGSGRKSSLRGAESDSRGSVVSVDGRGALRGAQGR